MKKYLFVLLTACVPQPVVKAPEPPKPVVAPVEKPWHRIAEFTAMVPLLGKCETWDDNSMLCHPTATTIMWCHAKKDEKPTCELSIDWTPPMSQTPTQVTDTKKKK